MKKYGSLLITGLILALLVTACSSRTAAPNLPSRGLEVSGKGSVEIKPDLARVSVGVRSQSEDITEALNENNARATAIKNTLVNLGVAEEDIQTSNFNIYPQQENRPMEMGDESETVDVFIVENTVNVVVRQLDDLGSILSAIVEGGANTIYGVTFDLAESSAAYAEARALAIADAQAQAEAIADAAGVSLGVIQTISIYDRGAPVARSDMAMEMPVGGSVPIASGTLAIQVTVQIAYAID